MEKSAHFITTVLALVGSDEHLKVIGIEKALGDIWPELHTDTTLGRAAAGHALRVRPQHVGHDARIRRLHEAVDFTHHVEGDTILGEETSVKNKDFGVDDASEGHCPEAVGKRSHVLHAELCLDLALEAVDLVHIFSLMVAAVEEHRLRIAALQRE